ncbi:thiolase family protein [Amycolatopsis carbonis]|uniref:Thiolase family protein n=1 Tax=Amycolatopsis carbonis TaxID=715471 RepID=A0A9Y2IDI5_9PSEU|nr:thiolase family protein [Amycolatopsis sp. 2-15]WIX76518.1 thiolase family protein [Amycolatopsis sp. 2-15]
MTAAVVAAYEHPYTRHAAAGTTTEHVLTAAFHGVLREAGLRPDDVDGLGVASFTLVPDHAIDLAWRLGLRLRWLMEDPHGGASALNLLQHAVRAVEAGDARTVVLLAGDHLDRAAFRELVANYNRATAETLTPLGISGPNALFAMLTQRHMLATGLTEEDYALVPISQRWWAGRNPGAVYRAPLGLDEYLAAPVVAAPLRRYDCVPVVTGADAVVVTAAARGARAEVRAFGASHNHDGQQGDGLHTGHHLIADRLWADAALGPAEVGLACVYDDYPVMALAQLQDLGLAPDPGRLLHERLAVDHWPLNPSGGQLSAGQAGAAAGLHGLVEAVQQLLGRAGERQAAARHALVTGYGMVLHRYGACANAAILEGKR